MNKPISILPFEIRSMIFERFFNIANLRDKRVPILERYSRLCTFLRDPNKDGIMATSHTNKEDITRMLTRMEIIELPRLQRSIRQLIASNNGRLPNTDLSGLCLRNNDLKFETKKKKN